MRYQVLVLGVFLVTPLFAQDADRSVKGGGIALGRIPFASHLSAQSRAAWGAATLVPFIARRPPLRVPAHPSNG